MLFSFGRDIYQDVYFHSLSVSLTLCLKSSTVGARGVILSLSNITCRVKHAALKWFFVVNQKIECHTSIRTPRKGLFNGQKIGRKIGLLDKF